ncbi:MAG: hypothetical protein V4584_00445 [Verrucomicrobiota bacterium]
MSNLSADLRDMKTQKNQSMLRAIAIPFLLAAIGVIWHFARPSVALKRGSDEPETVASSRTKTADRAASDPTRDRRRQESIALASQKWYEELLEKYPQMKPTFRDVPDEKNGFLQFLLLAESLKAPKLSEELFDILRGRSPWDSGKFRAWLEENKDYRDQILRIAELPDQSIKGLDLGRLFSCSRSCTEFGIILSGSAHLAFEEGDREAALRYARASISLGGHLTDIEAPSMLGAVIAAGYNKLTARIQ